MGLRLAHALRSEAADGWVVAQGRAVSPIINETVIAAWPNRDGGFEEWYFFSGLPKNLQLSAYCNWVGLSIADWAQIIEVPNGMDLRRQLEDARPVAVLGQGTRLFSIALDKAFVEEVRRTLAGLTAR